MRTETAQEKNIRIADLSDAPRMCEIYNQAVESRRSTCDLNPLAPKDIENWFHKRDFRFRPIWVYENENRVAGYLSVSNFWNDRPGYRVSADCGVYIARESQGHGVGSALLRHFLANAKTLEINSIVTSFFSDNEASQKLFLKYGFEQVGHCRRVANLEGVWKDLTIVQRDIT